MDTLDLPALVRIGERRIRGRLIREFIVVIVWLVILFLVFVVAQPSTTPTPFPQPVNFYVTPLFALLVAILDVGVRVWPSLTAQSQRSREVRQLIRHLVPEFAAPDVSKRQSGQTLLVNGLFVILFVFIGANVALGTARDDSVVFVRAVVFGGLVGYIVFRLFTTPGLLRYVNSDARKIERYLKRGEYEYVLERTEYNIAESKRRDLFRQYQALALLTMGRLDEAQQRLAEMLPFMYQVGSSTGFASVATQIAYIAMIESRFESALAWQSAAVQAAPEWEAGYLGMIQYYLFSWSYPGRLLAYIDATERLVAARRPIPLSAQGRVAIYDTLANGAAFCGNHERADAYFSIAHAAAPKGDDQSEQSEPGTVAGYMALYRGDRERAREVFKSILVRYPEGLNAIVAREGLRRCDLWSPDAIKREEATHE